MHKGVSNNGDSYRFGNNVHSWSDFIHVIFNCHCDYFSSQCIILFIGSRILATRYLIRFCPDGNCMCVSLCGNRNTEACIGGSCWRSHRSHTSAVPRTPRTQPQFTLHVEVSFYTHAFKSRCLLLLDTFTELVAIRSMAL